MAPGPDHRKALVIYWTIRELGDDVRYAEQLWFTLTAIGSTVVQALPGGMTNVLHHMLPLFFGDSGHNIRDAGIALDLGDVRALLFCDIAIHVSDEPALAAVLGAKGHAGNKPCPCCRNVTSRAWANAAHGLEPITSIDRSRWQPHTDETVRATLRRLERAAGVMPKTHFQQLETMLGWKYCPGNIMSSGDGGFKPIATLMFDWMHIFVAHGLLSYEIELFAEVVQRAQPRFGLFRRLDEYVRQWSFPRQFAAANTVFVKGRFSATASQSLSVIPVLAKFGRDVLGGFCDHLALQSLLSLCTVIELVQDVSWQSHCNADGLDDAIMAYARNHQLAHGLEHWMFKHHQALHLPGMMRQHQGLLSCFLMERLHRRAKRFMLGRLNPQAYERGVMTDITLRQLRDLQDPWHKPGLVDGTSAKHDVLEVARMALPSATGFLRAASCKTPIWGPCIPRRHNHL